MIQGRVLVVGGSPEQPSARLLQSLAVGSVVVACDHGADACMASGVHVDVLLGDGDSLSAAALSYVRQGCAREVAYEVEKDATDLGLAISWVREEYPACEVVFTGVSGGRTDHALAVLGVLARACDLQPLVEEETSRLWVLGPAGRRSVVFSPTDVGRTVSVVAPLGPACVNERGMRWNLEKGRLMPLDDLGVSNLVLEDGACVEAVEGTVLVFLERGLIQKHSIL